MNHPFIDGNKRIGHAALEATLMLNAYELVADVDSAEQAVLAVPTVPSRWEETTEPAGCEGGCGRSLS